MQERPGWVPAHADVPAGAALVRVLIPGQGNTFHFTTVVSERGVLALWKDASFEAE